MKTRKKIPKDTLRSLLLWKSPKRTRKHLQRKYSGNFYTDSLYTEPMVKVYSREHSPKNRKMCCYPKKRKVVPFPLKKTQSYVWKISGGMFMHV